MKPPLVALPVVLAMVLFPLRVFGNESSSPLGIAARLEARMAAGEGVLLPDADAEIVRHAGTVDLAEGDWPAAFLSRAGETICVAVSPFTGCYEFFDESGECFFTLVPVLPTTENWVAPFRHAEEGAHPDDALYAPWRLVDVWFLSHAESAETAEFSGRARSPSAPNLEPGNLRTCELIPTNLCFTAFSFAETNLYFAAAWPTNETLPDSMLDLYGSTNLLDPRWLFLSSHTATTNPVAFAVECASLPWPVAVTQHVHDATCLAETNVVLSPLDGTTVYTNVAWSCDAPRPSPPPGFFRLGTRHDSDGDGMPDAYERLVLGTSPDAVDTDLDVPVVAWIVRDDNGNNPATDEDHIRTMVDQANFLLRQVCISCYVHQICYTNKSNWLNLGTWRTTEFNDRFDEMVAVTNPVYGIEAHFVQSMTGVAGVNNIHGMALSQSASPLTFAHEAGHAMGLPDIYIGHRDTSLTVTGNVQRSWAQFDWAGDENRGFYPDCDGLPQAALVRRLIMCGDGSPGRGDFSCGPVHGIRRTLSSFFAFEFADVPVGLFPGTIPPVPHND